VSASVVLALDVGGTSIKSGLVELPATLRGEVRSTPFASAAPAGAVLGTFASLLWSHAHEVEELHGLALGFPGPFEYDTGICRVRGVGGKFEALYGADLGAEFAGVLDLPRDRVRFRNDAQAAVVGEALHGAGQGVARIVGVTLGTGLGSAFLADGAPITSGDEVPEGGELYHLPGVPDGPQADDLFSRRGLEERLGSHGADAIKDAAARARAGDAHVAEVFRSWGHDLGTFLARPLTSFGADRLLVLGGISAASDLFGEALGEALPCAWVPGTRGAEAALLGAAALFSE
jgi:glucokinase